MVTFQQFNPADDCRWPFGTPGKDDFRFCGAPRNGISYCNDHGRVAYRT